MPLYCDALEGLGGAWRGESGYQWLSMEGLEIFLLWVSSWTHGAERWVYGTPCLRCDVVWQLGGGLV